MLEGCWFRLQLVGEPALWVNQAEAVGEKRVSDVNEMIRYRERRFETAPEQHSEEELCAFMSRLRQLAF